MTTLKRTLSRVAAIFVTLFAVAPAAIVGGIGLLMSFLLLGVTQALIWTFALIAGVAIAMLAWVNDKL